MSHPYPSLSDGFFQTSGTEQGGGAVPQRGLCLQEKTTAVPHPGSEWGSAKQEGKVVAGEGV